MKTLFSALLLILAIPMVFGGVFEIGGFMGQPNLLLAIACSSSAQITLLAAGFISSPKRARVGLVRSIVLGYFILQSLSLPVLLFAYLDEKFGHVELYDHYEFLWFLVEAVSALALLSITVRVWNIPLGKRASDGVPNSDK